MQVFFKKIYATLLSLALILVTSGIFFTNPTNAAALETPLKIHEWGTMTSWHRSPGDALGGLNNTAHQDVLPAFVHISEDRGLQTFSKGNDVIGHPDVTMRLETPVVYFYPDATFDKSKKINFKASFNAGLLNEFYPKAVTLDKNIRRQSATRLDATSRSSLEWKDIELGGNWPVPQTNMPVWLAPRQVKATKVRVGSEAEHYLFYRGVANIPSLLATQHSKTENYLKISTRAENTLNSQKLIIPNAWYISIQADKTLAFKNLGALTLNQSNNLLLKTEYQFPKNTYTQAGKAKLREEIHQALVRDGLFDDEAWAMLNTWDSSYFEQSGERILFIAPKAWMDHYIPLEVSVPSHITRVFVGRIDLK
jgi:hypothetical protein